MLGDVRIGYMIYTELSTEELNLRNQLILRSRDYLVQSTVLNTNAPLDPKLVFRDLQTLCIRIKDELIEPILVDIHIALNLSPRLTLCTLPVDIIVSFFVVIRILLLLPLSALGKLVLCNWHLYRLIKNCAPIWRIQLAHLNAKRQPLLNAALTRQQKQQREQEQRRQQQQRDQDSPSGVANRIPCTATDNRTDEEPTACTPDPNCTNPQVTDEDSLSETQSVQSPLPYERFVARYRSLLVQRKCRGLSPSFV
ncbi:unnamed protein product [Calicophoron daubneyi]|uniref:F-box domain-containing protein n=1 Tax=Calicophoron daubneyi TaxID=300641 RepID=A0AAV2TZN1_CALDB